MAKATTTIAFANGDQVTSAKLNQIISGFSLGSDSVDGTTMLLTAGVLSVGDLGTSNFAANTIPAGILQDDSIELDNIPDALITGAKLANLTVEAAQIAATTITFGKLATAALAAQADMQSETASKLAAAATMKYHPGIPKAYGTVSIESGVTTITGGYNITSASDTGTGRRITLAVTMANTNYTVVGFYKDTGAVANSVGWAAVSTTQFDLHAGAEAAGRAISFIVYGTLA